MFIFPQNKQVQNRPGARLKIGLTAIVFLVSFCGFAARGGAASKLEEKVLESGPQALAFAREQGWKTIGVLKFRAQRGKRPPTDSIGDINSLMARYLEFSLQQANNNAGRPLVIVRKASETANQIDGAAHHTRKGQQKLLDSQFPGDDGTTAVVDGFLTGVVKIDSAAERMEVRYLGFGRGKTGLAAIPKPFVVSIGSRLKGLIGQPHSRRFHKRSVGTPRPTDEPQFNFEVYYDDRLIDQEEDSATGVYRIEEPRLGENVKFTMSAQGPEGIRLGVVIKVNGESTLYRQRAADEYCTPWVIHTNERRKTIWGFFDGERDANGKWVPKDFKILSPKESREFNYGPDTGLITVAVFREQPSGRVEAPAIPDEDIHVTNAALAKTDAPADLGFRRARGVIAPGKRLAPAEVPDAEKFIKDPNPLGVIMIRYYDPR